MKRSVAYTLLVSFVNKTQIFTPMVIQQWQRQWMALIAAGNMPSLKSGVRILIATNPNYKTVINMVAMTTVLPYNRVLDVIYDLGVC